VPRSAETSRAAVAGGPKLLSGGDEHGLREVDEEAACRRMVGQERPPEHPVPAAEVGHAADGASHGCDELQHDFDLRRREGNAGARVLNERPGEVLALPDLCLWATHGIPARHGRPDGARENAGRACPRRRLGSSRGSEPEPHGGGAIRPRARLRLRPKRPSSRPCPGALLSDNHAQLRQASCRSYFPVDKRSGVQIKGVSRRSCDCVRHFSERRRSPLFGPGGPGG
jgi:hypothetical protein